MPPADNTPVPSLPIYPGHEFPPLAPSSAPAAAPEVVPASYGARFGNWIFDRILSIWISMFLSVVIALIFTWTVLHDKDVNIYLQYAYYIGSYLLFQFLYYFVLEQAYGRTFGKALTGTQVVNQSFGRAGAGQLMLRTIARVIPFDELSIFFGTRRTWHDDISSTLVVSSRTLPETERRRGIAMKVCAVLLFLPVIALFLFWPVYQSLSGGERVDLSQHMPSDLRLVQYQEIQAQKSQYEALTYRGNNRTIVIHRLIAGYDYDPHQPCMYMQPTTIEYGYNPIDASLACTQIASSPHAITAYRVTVSTKDPSILNEAPDYYIQKPPYRYAIKATKGTLSEDEVKNMTTDYKTYTAKDLRQIASSNQ